MDDSPPQNAIDIHDLIFVIRDQKVLFDFHLSQLYRVETRVLKQQVRRNHSRFPADFMFQLTKAEWREVITNCDMLLGSNKFSPKPSMVFTEQSVAMLSGVLRSDKAIQVNIQIMRTFVQMRKLVDSTKELKEKLEKLEKKYDASFSDIFVVLKQLLKPKGELRKPVGFILKQTKNDKESA